MLIRNCRNLGNGMRLSARIHLVDGYKFGRYQQYAHVYHPINAFFVRFSSSDRNKVEETIRMLKELRQQQQQDNEKREKEAQEKQSLVTKPSLPVRVWNQLKNPKELGRIVWRELVHYWHGFRLFFLEARLSTKYLIKLLRGQSLSRRERQQLVRTSADIIRLVPFSVFVIVPFMEFLFPFYIKLFPQMMPSTFHDISKEEEKQLKQMKAKIETAKFLQDTLEEIALIRKNKGQLDEASTKAFEFAQFLKKVREGGGYVTNSDLFKFIKLFEDELTLDNLDMSQLRALCRLLGISKLGNAEILRFRLHLKLRELKADDRLIAAEGGVEVLSVQELQAACRARGMRAIGLSENRLRAQLKQWLELSLDDQVPPSLLLLSRAMFFPEELNFTERLRTIIAALPKEIGEHTTLKLKELEGMTDPKARIELLRSIEQSLKQERTEEKQRTKEVQTKGQVEEAKMEKVLTEAEATTQKLHEIAGKTEEPGIVPTATALDELTKAMAKKVKSKEKLDPSVLEKLENILHGSPEQEVKHDIAELKEKVIEHTEDLLEIGTLADNYEESKGSKRLRDKVHKLISKVDLLAATLEGRRREIKETIADPAVPNAVQAKKERLVHIKDLIESLGKLQQITGDVKQIENTLVAMDADVDGKVEADLILEVLELLSKHKDMHISAEEMTNLVELLKKEDLIEELEERIVNGETPSLAEAVDEALPKLPPDEEYPVRSMAPESVSHRPTESHKENPSNPTPPPV